MGIAYSGIKRAAPVGDRTKGDAVRVGSYAVFVASIVSRSGKDP
jgi:hypothetical protein